MLAMQNHSACWGFILPDVCCWAFTTAAEVTMHPAGLRLRLWGHSIFCWNQWKGWQQWELGWGQSLLRQKSKRRNITNCWITAQLQCWLLLRVRLCLPVLCFCCFALFTWTIIFVLSDRTSESSLWLRLCKCMGCRVLFVSFWCYSVKKRENLSVLFALRTVCRLHSAFPERQKQTGSCYEVGEYVRTWEQVQKVQSHVPLQLFQVCFQCPVQPSAFEPGFLVSIQK